MPKSKIIIAPARGGKFRVKYYAANGELLAVTEVLNSKQSAQKNIDAMRELITIPRGVAEVL